MQLAKIQNNEENQVLTKGLTLDYWIGIRNLKRGGLFKFQDGSYPKYFKWSTGSPTSRSDVESCVALQPNGSWIDANCNTENFFVCQKGKF